MLIPIINFLVNRSYASNCHLIYVIIISFDIAFLLIVTFSENIPSLQILLIKDNKLLITFFDNLKLKYEMYFYIYHEKV